MWLLLVALCLAQGLSDAIPCMESQIISIIVPLDGGYFQTVNQIPGGREEAGSRGPRLPVLLHHGLVLGGGNWVSNFPNSSLGFSLQMDARYDIWIRNSQGNTWACRHLNLSVDQEEFWDFSFHEMAVYDLPAMVGFVLRQTGQEKLFYVGHAQGSSLGFIAFSSMPQLAEKIKLFFALAPLYTFHHVKGPVLKIAFLPDAVLKAIFGTKQLTLVGRKERATLAKTCSNLLTAEVCENEIFLIGGYNKKNLNMSRLDVYLAHFPDYTSVKTLLHWGQSVNTVFYNAASFALETGFIAFSSLPQLAEKIKMFFVVSAACSLHAGKGPVLSLFYLPDVIIKGTVKPTNPPEILGWLPQQHQC
ncbi:lipase member M-like [Morus bassanus]